MWQTGNAYEGNNTLELSCNERPISSIKFASFGTPQGTCGSVSQKKKKGNCGSFQKGSCEATKDALSILQNVYKFFRCLFLLSLTFIYIYIYIYLYIHFHVKII